MKIVVLAFAGLLILLGLFFVISKGENQQPNFIPSDETMEVSIIDANSSQPISNTKIDVYGDNGIRCVTTPCPTESRGWSGVTDSNGIIKLPVNIDDDSDITLRLWADGYIGVDLTEILSAPKEDPLVIRLEPKQEIK